MDISKKIEKFSKNINKSIFRYPLTIFSLLINVVVISLSIENYLEIYDRIILSILVCVFLSATFEHLYERFFNKKQVKILFYIISIGFSFTHYIIIDKIKKQDVEIFIKSLILIFIFFLLFILIPTIKRRINFSQNFLAIFKASFLSYFYASIIFIGTSLILSAFNLLISDISYKLYSHAANLIFTLFAPIYFLGLMPLYEDDEDLNKKIECPKFLDILISYILIPLISIFTIILILYLLKSFTGRFWEDAALEPLLVSYSIAVLIIYILASTILNKFTNIFKKVFPKILLVIVLLQAISSILQISSKGITYGRYFAILFAIFSTIAGLTFGFINKNKISSIIVVLIIMSTISITPLVGAFSVSKYNQVKSLDKVLIKNKMLENNEIKKNMDISDEDKEIIRRTFSYIDQMNYNEDIIYLKNKNLYKDFEKIFGFPRYDYMDPNEIESDYFNMILDPYENIDIKGYDILASMEIYIYDKKIETYESNQNIFINDKSYKFVYAKTDDDTKIILKNDLDEELISFYLSDLLKSEQDNKELVNFEEASNIYENNNCKINVISKEIYIVSSSFENTENYKLNILISIKNKE